MTNRRKPYRRYPPDTRHDPIDWGCIVRILIVSLLVLAAIIVRWLT